MPRISSLFTYIAVFSFHISNNQVLYNCNFAKSQAIILTLNKMLRKFFIKTQFCSWKKYNSEVNCTHRKEERSRRVRGRAAAQKNYEWIFRSYTDACFASRISQRTVANNFNVANGRFCGKPTVHHENSNYILLF